MAINLNRVRGDRSPYRLVVREGDTLQSLSELLEVDQTALRAANPNVDLDAVVPGMELIIPDASVIEVGNPSVPGTNVGDEDGANESDEPSHDGSISEAVSNVISFPSVILTEELSQATSTELRSDSDDDTKRSAEDDTPDVSELKINEFRVEEEQSTTEEAEDSSSDISEQQEDQAPAVKESQEDPSPSTSERRPAADAESSRTRFETISWKPFPKI